MASLFKTIQRNIFLGVLALIPAWVTILLLSAILTFLREQAAPMFDQLVTNMDPGNQTLHHLIAQPWFQVIISVLVMVIFFGLVGWLASLWVGQKAVRVVDMVMDKIPLARSIYGAIKGITNALEKNDSKEPRVVLIDFPMPGMKTFGLITNTIKDAKTDKDLAVVFVPTSPNPTGGYLEIVPLESLTPTNWTVEEAMSFLISGGTDVDKELTMEKTP